jgi:mono/diheme cytochrome c family protein
MNRMHVPIRLAPVTGGAAAALLLTLCESSPAAPAVDVSQLPPAATNHVDFSRDIQPIFERSCIRCHGAERPKSRFRLVTRDSAMAGGENGVDIVPFESAKSPLVLYSARLVDDMEMPPPEKGEPLTQEEIGRLRAWIDQGAAWGTNANAPGFSAEMSPTLGWTTVSGDEKKYRERFWTKEGWNGGAESFSLTNQIGKDSRLTVDGHALVDDYRVLLTLEKSDLGFARFGWEQFRKYYDDLGGYFPGFTPSTFSLDQDLHLDTGRAWADFGLTLPNWPRMVLGYEYQYRQGNEATLQWGPVSSGGETRNIYPASKNLDEHVHIIKFDLDHEIAGIQIEDRFRGEFYDLHSTEFNTLSFNLGDPGPSQLDEVGQSYHYFQGANTVRLEKAFTDWLLASAGYLYSKLNADATFSLDAQFPLGAPGFYAVDSWHSQNIVLERETHSFNASALLGPWEGLSLSGGVLSDWTRQTGFGQANLDIVTPSFTFAGPAILDGDYDTTTVEENAALRYTKIPFTVLFAEARLQQESRGISEETSGVFMISCSGPRPQATCGISVPGSAFRPGNRCPCRRTIAIIMKGGITITCWISQRMMLTRRSFAVATRIQTRWRPSSRCAPAPGPKLA